MQKEDMVRQEAIKYELFKATGAKFRAVDHGMVTSFYSTSPLALASLDEAYYEAFVNKVYKAVDSEIKRFDMDAFDYKADPTSFYGMEWVGQNGEGFIFEFRVPLEQMQLPPQVLAEMAKGVGAAIAPEAKLGLEKMRKLDFPKEVLLQMRQFLGRFPGGRDFSYN
jgi:hypothetical protein